MYERYGFPSRVVLVMMKKGGMHSVIITGNLPRPRGRYDKWGEQADDIGCRRKVWEYGVRTLLSRGVAPG